eukprot:5559305-Amphidinium_carterae.1
MTTVTGGMIAKLHGCQPIPESDLLSEEPQCLHQDTLSTNIAKHHRLTELCKYVLYNAVRGMR